MISEGSIFWIYKFCLTHQLYLSILMFFVASILGFLNKLYDEMMVSNIKKIKTKYLLVISIPHIVLLLLSFVLVWGYLNWSFYPISTFMIMLFSNHLLLFFINSLTYLSMLLPFIIILFLKYDNLKILGLTKPYFTWLELLKTSSATVIVIFTNHYYINHINSEYIFIPNSIVDYQQLFFKLTFIFFFVVIVPFIEELFFRGVIFNLFVKAGFKNYSNFIQSILYGAVFFNNDTLPLFLLNGFFYGYIRKNTGSLFPAIIIRILWNILAIC